VQIIAAAAYAAAAICIFPVGKNAEAAPLAPPLCLLKALSVKK